MYQLTLVWMGVRCQVQDLSAVVAKANGVVAWAVQTYLGKWEENNCPCGVWG